MAENRNNIVVHKSRKVILDILDTRGYDITDYQGFSINEIYSLYTNDQLDLLLTHKTKETKIYIKYYNLEKTIRPNNIHEIIDDLFNVEQILSPKDDLIIIIKDEPNDTLQKLQRYIFEHDQIFVTIINIERLQYNILNHTLVPKCTILGKSEIDELKQKYNIMDTNQLPEISRFDPQALAICMRPGQVCKLERESSTALFYDYYRICV